MSSLTELLSLIKQDSNDQIDISTITDSFDLLDSPYYEAALAADTIQRTKVTADTDPRWRLQADGQQEWGDGSGDADVTMKRSAAGELEIEGDLKVTGNLSIVPAGTLTMFAGDTEPDGWKFCDGSEIDRTVFATLFAAIGTTYGDGDAATTFNLPDLQGKFPVGIKSADSDFDVLGDTGGAKTHTLTTAETPAHAHTNLFSNGLGTGTPNPVNSISAGAAAGRWTAAISSSGGAGGAHNNLPPFIALNFIIKT